MLQLRWRLRTSGDDGDAAAVVQDEDGGFGVVGQEEVPGLDGPGVPGCGMGDNLLGLEPFIDDNLELRRVDFFVWPMKPFSMCG